MLNRTDLQLIPLIIILFLFTMGIVPNMCAQKLYGDLENTSHYREQDCEEFTGVQWKFRTGGRVFSSPVIYQDVVYCGSGDNHLYALNIHTGEENWRYRTNGAVHSTPAIANGHAYFGSTDGNFYSVDISDSRFEWNFTTEGEQQVDIWDYFLSSPAVYNGVVYFGSGDGHLYALDAVTGEEKWSFQTNGVIHASPVIKDHTIYFGSFDGYFYAVDLESGQMQWKFRTIGDQYFPKGEIPSGASIFDGMVYFGSRDYNIYALNLETGRGMWNMKEQFSWIVTTPAVTDTAIFFGTSDSHRIYSLDTQTGTVRWQTPVGLNVFGGLTIGRKLGYVGSLDGKLHAVDLSNGEIRWTYQTEASKTHYSRFFTESGDLRTDLVEIYSNDIDAIYNDMLNLGSVLSTPSIRDGVVYFSSADSCIYALR